jgi:hypothetical protein
VGSDLCKLWIKFITKSPISSSFATLKLIFTDRGLSSLRMQSAGLWGDIHFSGLNGFAV